MWYAGHLTRLQLVVLVSFDLRVYAEGSLNGQ